MMDGWLIFPAGIIMGAVKLTKLGERFAGSDRSGVRSPLALYIQKVDLSIVPCRVEEKISYFASLSIWLSWDSTGIYLGPDVLFVIFC